MVVRGISLGYSDKVYWFRFRMANGTDAARSMQVPLNLWGRDAFFVAEQSRTMFEGLYYGIVLVMILYNLFVYRAVGERSFLYYVGYIAAMPLFLASLHGVSFQYLWPHATWWNDQAIIVFLNLAIVFGATFSLRFLNVRRHNHPVLNLVTVSLIVIAGSLAAAGIVVPYSDTDALTGLKNRGHFDRVFKSAVVRAYRFEQTLSLMVLDIDHFKGFNDTYGHLVGDDCLQMVAGCVGEFVTRPQDLAARYGGEEFVVLLPDTPEEGAVRVAQKIRRKIAETGFRVSDETLHLTISIGICSACPDHADATKEIFTRADEALYEAKGRGRNKVVSGSEISSAPSDNLA